MPDERSARTDNRRPELESLFKQHGIKFSYVGNVPLSSVERHIAAQSRLRDVNKSTVRKYSEQMKNGAVFPPIVLWANGYDGYGVVDGNTRTEAKRKLGIIETDAYLVDVADANEAIMVSAIINGQNGEPLSPEEIRHAVIAAGLMEHPLTAERLARSYGIAPSRVSQIQNVHKVTGSLTSLGVDPNRLTDSAKYSLSKLADTAVQRDLANLVIDADVPQADISVILKEINGKTSEAERLKVVHDARTDRQGQIEARETGRIVKHQPLVQAAMIYGRLLKMWEKYPDSKQYVPVDEARLLEHRERVQEARDILTRVLEAQDEEIEARRAEGRLTEPSTTTSTVLSEG